MKIYAVKNDKNSYPNLEDGLLEVGESKAAYFKLKGSHRKYPYKDFTFYDRNGDVIVKHFLKT